MKNAIICDHSPVSRKIFENAIKCDQYLEFTAPMKTVSLIQPNTTGLDLLLLLGQAKRRRNAKPEELDEIRRRFNSAKEATQKYCMAKRKVIGS